MIQGCGRLWASFRSLTGDDAYERYLETCLTSPHNEGLPVSRREFQAARVARRWSGITRCC
jgi:uncharacterized short protein YbdD (DUF466 family)